MFPIPSPSSPHSSSLLPNQGDSELNLSRISEFYEMSSGDTNNVLTLSYLNRLGVFPMEEPTFSVTSECSERLWLQDHNFRGVPGLRSTYNSNEVLPDNEDFVILMPVFSENYDTQDGIREEVIAIRIHHQQIVAITHQLVFQRSRLQAELHGGVYSCQFKGIGRPTVKTAFREIMSHAI